MLAVLLAALASGCPMSTDACAEVEGLELSAECPLSFQGTSDDGAASACYLRHTVQVGALERADELGCCLPPLDEPAPAGRVVLPRARLGASRGDRLRRDVRGAPRAVLPRPLRLTPCESGRVPNSPGGFRRVVGQAVTQAKMRPRERR